MCESTVSEEPIDADDLLEDPRTDAEALCLCGLLWAPADAARQVVAVLTAADCGSVWHGRSGARWGYVCGGISGWGGGGLSGANRDS